jgi:hypothetical protein
MHELTSNMCFLDNQLVAFDMIAAIIPGSFKMGEIKEENFRKFLGPPDKFVNPTDGFYLHGQRAYKIVLKNGGIIYVHMIREVTFLNQVMLEIYGQPIRGFHNADTVFHSIRESDSATFAKKGLRS